MKHFYVILFLLGFSQGGWSQVISQRAYGGLRDDQVSHAARLSDNGFLLVGVTQSFDGSQDVMVVKLDAQGDTTWVRSISNVINNNSFEEGYAGCEASDGYIITGRVNNGNLYVAKISKDGNSLLWQYYYTGIDNNPTVRKIIPFSNNSDGNSFLICTMTNNNRTSLIQIRNDGSLVQTYTADSWGPGLFTDMTVIGNNIYLCGYTNDRQRVILYKIDKNNWTSYSLRNEYTLTYQNNNSHNFTEVKLIEDTNQGLTLVTRGDGWRDAYILQINSSGTLQTMNVLGLPDYANPQFTDIVKTAQGYALIGYVNTNGFGGEDVLYASFDSNFAPKEARLYGGANNDRGNSIFLNGNGTVTLFANAYSMGNNWNIFSITTNDATHALCNERTIELYSTALTTFSQSNVNGTIYQQNPSRQNVNSSQINKGLFRYLCACSDIDEIITTAPACNGTKVTFWYPGFTAGVTDHTWNFGSDASVTTSKNDSVTVVFKTPGIKYVSLDIQNSGCLVSNTKAVVIHQTPVVSSVSVTSSGNNSYCSGAKFDATAVLTDTTGEHLTYSWDFGSDAETRLSEVLAPKGFRYAKAGQKTVSLSVRSEYCTSVPKSTTVTVNPMPVAQFETNTPRCKGTPVSFQNTGTPASEGATHIWILTGADVSSPSESFTTVYRAAGLMTAQLITSIGNCRDTATKKITIYETPKIAGITLTPSNASAGNNYCEGASFNASAFITDTIGEHISYVWSFGADAEPVASSVLAPKNIRYATAGSKTASLTLQTEHCTSLPATATVQINKMPIADFSTNATRCDGLPITFKSTGTTGVAYNWTFGTADDASSTTGAAETDTVTYSKSGVKTVTLVTTLTSNNISCSDTISKSFTVYKTPKIPTLSVVSEITKPLTRCEGTRFDVTAKVTDTAGEHISYAWNFGAEAQPQTSDAAQPKAFYYESAGKKVVSLVVSSEHCTSLVKDTTIAIDTLPRTTITADGFDAGSNDVRICANTELKLGVSPARANRIYQWYLPTNSFETKKVTASSVTVAPKAAETVYTVLVTDSKTHCIFTDSILVGMLPAAISNAGGDVTICRGESIQIGAGLIEGQSYQWKLAKHLSDTTSPNPIATPDSTTTYRLSARYRNCPEVTDEVRVIVHQLPKVQATDDKHRDSTEIARGESVQLIVIGALQYIWSPVEGLSNEGIYNPIASPENSTLYRVTGTDIYGCSNKDSIMVRVVTPKIWIPTAFTPNGDNLNDGFRVRGEGISKFELHVFSRAGEPIFFSEDQKQAWDGRKEGTNSEMPQGAYIYYTKGMLSDGSLFEKRGVINLLR